MHSLQIIEDLFSQTISERTLQLITRGSSDELEEVCDFIKECVTNADENQA
jgi:hypothetical protein